MPSMSTNININGTKILVMFSAPIWTEYLNEWRYINLYIDDNLVMRNYIALYAYNDYVSFQYLETGLTPGTHKVDLKWYSWSGGLRQMGNSHSERVLKVIEI